MRDQPFSRWIDRWGPAVLVAALIFLASATPSTSLPNFGLWDLLLKKSSHMAGYGLLALTVLRGLGGPGRKTLAAALAITVLYAASDEIHQAFVAGRGSAWFDVLIDAAGAAAALTLWGSWGLLQRITGFGTVKRQAETQTTKA